MIEEQLLPSYDISDGVAVVVDADLPRTWNALMEVDLIELGRQRPLIGMLGALRALPELVGQLVHGEPPSRPPERSRCATCPLSRASREAGAPLRAPRG